MTLSEELRIARESSSVWATLLNDLDLDVIWVKGKKFYGVPGSEGECPGCGDAVKTWTIVRDLEFLAEGISFVESSEVCEFCGETLREFA